MEPELVSKPAPAARRLFWRGPGKQKGRHSETNVVVIGGDCPGWRVRPPPSVEETRETPRVTVSVRKVSLWPHVAANPEASARIVVHGGVLVVVVLLLLLLLVLLVLLLLLLLLLLRPRLGERKEESERKKSGGDLYLYPRWSECQTPQL